MTHTEAQKHRGRAGRRGQFPVLLLCASVPLCEIFFCCVMAAFAAVPIARIIAQEPAQPSGPSSADELALEQSRIADKYAKLEQLMLKMAELEGLSNPKRAQLLTRAVEQSKEKLTKTQL